jgi:hypothetical protein
MPLPSLQPVLSEFKAQVSNATKLLTTIESSPGVLHQPQVDLIFELAFLKIFIAWEQFLENTFIRYMCSASSLSGKRPTRIVSVRHLDDALRVICGERPYADWTSVEVVVDRANRFFDSGEPYATPLQSAAVELTNMRRIRNHIVHHSNKSRDDFNRLLVNVYGFRPQGMTAGRFLRQRLSVQGQQRIQEYAKTLESLAKMIIS